MGCDGGTIPKRKEVVKTKSAAAKEKREIELMNKWGYCAASDRNLRFCSPIVAGNMGDLMTKEGAIEFMLEYRREDLKAYHRVEDRPGLDSLRSMKDFKELKLKKLTDDERKARRESSKEIFWADFVCPITDLEANGKYSFMFSWQCGCVVSERAIKELPDEKKCLVCQKPYEPDHDLVYINPTTPKQISKNQTAFMIRRLKGDKKFMRLVKAGKDSRPSKSSRSAQKDQDDSEYDDEDGEDDLPGPSSSSKRQQRDDSEASSSSDINRPGPSTTNKRPRK